jgi:hypothetical protein
VPSLQNTHELIQIVDESQSTTTGPNIGPFDMSYGSRKSPFVVNGTLVTDHVSVNGKVLDGATMAIVNHTNGKIGSFKGVLGLAGDSWEDGGKQYPSLIDLMHNAGHIKSRTFAVYLENILEYT